MAKNRNQAAGGNAGAKGGGVVATTASLDQLQAALSIMFTSPGRGGSEEKRLKTMTWEELADRLIAEYRENRDTGKVFPAGFPNAGQPLAATYLAREGTDFVMDAKLSSIRARIQRALCDETRRDAAHLFDASILKTKDIPAQEVLVNGRMVKLPNSVAISVVGIPVGAMTEEELADAGIEQEAEAEAAE
jgi:hypothetical protein